ncbi:hypothetical protein [Castellaniella defragrans]|jgi:hypothetical protein|uniref:Secreted protein n=1 Tax=Castellaniella defragrans (strain DSM 12143 / CCUG 39792 / 65Phen) TaxID=1437824 RepID=W8WWE5_CASD6|nr:hypothetical protein [Castellaniella defragrans]CDM24058.1 secreted protein [Castellaniella defragrans 65Phen]
MRWFGWLLAAWTGIVPAGVLAAGVATVQAGDRTLTVSFDGTDARVDVSGVDQGYLLMRGGKLYSVLQAGGRPLVMEGDAAARLLGARALQVAPDMIRTLSRIEPTGARKTVAGRVGAVYAVSYRDEQGRARSGQGVLGGQPEVRELTRALGRMAVLLQTSAGQSPDGARQVLDALEARNLGLLAYENQFRVERLAATAPAPGSLELPAQPAQLPPELGQLLQGLRRP